MTYGYTPSLLGGKKCQKETTFHFKENVTYLWHPSFIGLILFIQYYKKLTYLNFHNLCFPISEA